MRDHPHAIMEEGIKVFQLPFEHVAALDGPQTKWHIWRRLQRLQIIAPEYESQSTFFGKLHWPSLSKVNY